MSVSTSSPSPSESTICPLLNEHAFNCPICLDLLCEPVTLSCGHTFCEHCVSQWIACHASSKSRSKGKCRCPSCKATIYNKFTQPSISYTLRTFLKNQFTARYKERHTETYQSRERWNNRIIKLRKQRDEELKQLSKCCGIIKLQRWFYRNFELMMNPHLHRSATSWLLRWLLVYCIILAISLPFLVPMISNALNGLNGNNITIKLYFIDDIWSALSKISSLWNFSSIVHLLQSVLQYFGLIVPITNTGYLSDNYIMNTVIPYEDLGNIYHSNCTDLYYKNLFAHWKSSELKGFMKRYGIDNTCLERSCYTDDIIEYLKISEWKTLQEDPLPVRMLQQYMDHYEINYDECYISFWSKDYQCIAKKAASTKIVNDVYYNKKYLLSFKSQEKRRNKKSHRKQKKNSKDDDIEKKYQENKRNTVFGFHDIGNFAFNVLSGLR